jgi:AcrR family transcriptional regulator
VVTTPESTARDHILAAVGRLLAGRTDPDDLTIKRLAEEAGVSQGLVYLHFENREAVLRTVSLEARLRHDVAVDAARARIPPGIERVRTRLEMNIDWSLANPALYRALVHVFEPPAALQAITSMEELGLAGVIGDVADALADQGSAADPETVATMMWMNEHGFLSTVLLVPPTAHPSPLALRSAFVDFQVRAVLSA